MDPIPESSFDSRPQSPQKSPLISSFRTKTQKAIQLINRHEENKYNFLKTINTSKKFLNTSPDKNDHEYFSIIEIPEIFIQESVKVQLLPYSDLVYKLGNPFFVISQQKEVIDERNAEKIDEKDEDDTSSQGTVPIRSSQVRSKKHQNQSNSVLNCSLLEQNIITRSETNCKLKIYVKNYRGGASQIFLYFENNSHIKDFNLHFHKFIINSEKIISVNLDDFLNKKWVYIRLKSQSELSMFTMRVEQQSFLVKKRFVTELAESSKDSANRKLPQLKGSKSLRTIKSIELSKPQQNQLKNRSGSLIMIRQSNPTLYTSTSQNSPNNKGQTKEILQKLKKEELQRKKKQQQKKQEEILQKKAAVEIVKEKELILKSKALQMKKLVEQYKIIHEQETNYNKVLHPKLAVLMILPRFHKICSQMVMLREKGMKMAWKTRMLTKKFTKIVKKKYKESIQHVKSRKTREMIGIVSFTTLFAKILHKNNIQKCENVIMSTINLSKPGLIINQSFDFATNYRRSIRIIQKAWLNQYNARMEMFQKYVKNQVQQLIVKYPYFKYLQGKFTTDNIAKTLAYKYLQDESSKLNFLFEDYRQKLKQIEQFKEMNNRIIEFNKSSLKKRQRPLLQVPKTPCFPSLRYFRNISFLKSMVRGWFELEYRKWTKANKAASQPSKEERKKTLSPQKQKKMSVGKASINNIDLSSPRKEQKR